MLSIPGWGIGAIEISLYLFISFMLKKMPLFTKMNTIAYYWICMTILTGIWEMSYIYNYEEVVKMATQLISNKTHVWTEDYSLSYVNPWKLSQIFYAEYGAWADREYMATKNDWSHFVEGTHMIFCGTFAFFGMLTRLFDNQMKSIVLIAMAMAFQLMNSILYMVEYEIQCHDIHSVNYNNATDFPAGSVLDKRPFMYVNLFWMIMPTYILCYEINHVPDNYKKIENTENTKTMEDLPSYKDIDSYKS